MAAAAEAPIAARSSAALPIRRPRRPKPHTRPRGSGPQSGTTKRTLSFERTRRRVKEATSQAGAGGLRAATGAASLLSRATHGRKSDDQGLPTSENP